MFLKSLCYSFFGIASLEMAFAQAWESHNLVSMGVVNRFYRSLASQPGQMYVADLKEDLKQQVTALTREDYENSGFWYRVTQQSWVGGNSVQTTPEMQLQKWKNRCNSILDERFFYNNNATITQRMFGIIPQNVRKEYIIQSIGAAADGYMYPEEGRFPSVACDDGCMERLLTGLNAPGVQEAL